MQTYCRGTDGFGSQMYALFLGYLNCVRDNKPYCFSEINGIRLVNIGDANQHIGRVKDLVNNIVTNLKAPFCKDIEGPIERESFPYKYATQDSFKLEYLQNLQNAWPMDSPYEEDTFNVCIHIRRGQDVGPMNTERWENSDYYNKLIFAMLRAYPNATIHTVSWDNAGLDNFHSSRVIQHVETDGNNFLEHFNRLVWADICFIASSTFSLSAALFNRNKVLLDPYILRLQNTPVSDYWVHQFHQEQKLWKDSSSCR